MADPPILSSRALKSMVPSPLLLTGFLRDHLKRRYQAEHLVQQELRGLIWSPADSTGILIESFYRWRPGITGKRPAVIIKAGPRKRRKLSIGNTEHNAGVRESGDSFHAKMWEGNHTLFCLGETGGQSQLLATDVEQELSEFAPLLREMLDFLELDVVEVGEAAEIRDQPGTWATPVVVSYAYNHSWRIRERKPTLTTVSFALLLEQ